MEKIGLPPGTIVPGELETPLTGFCLHYGLKQYGLEPLDESTGYDIALRQPQGVNWFHLYGANNAKVLNKLRDEYGIDPMVLEDIQNTDQRPKLETYENYLFLTFKVLVVEKEEKKLRAHQFSLLQGRNFVFTFSEDGLAREEMKMVGIIQERITKGIGRIRKKGADYLAYTLMDITVDHYFLVMDQLEELYDELEEVVVESEEEVESHDIYHLKKQIMNLRRGVWPLREFLNTVQKEEIPLIQKETKLFYRDIHDHVIRIMDFVDLYRDMLVSLVDIHKTNISNRMNGIMKVLTILASIFIPLTFIAGVYGMNFSNMPELKIPWAYHVVLGLMLSIALGMIIYFKRKKWF